MATVHETPTTPDKVTAFDEFNLSIPRESFPAEGMAARAAQGIVNSFAWTDANPMLNLSSFVTTYAEPEASRFATRSMYQELHRPRHVSRRCSRWKREMVKWLHDLWNGPKGVEPYGAATIGSSEACMLAGLAHKWNWRAGARRRPARTPAGRTWSPAATCRSSGRSSCATSTSSRASFR